MCSSDLPNVTANLSGVSRSTDGGATWSEVPVGPGGLGLLPTVPGGQIYGDPEVKWDPVNQRFVYASLYVRPSDCRQGLSIHLSNADGSAWSNPIEVTPAFGPAVSADKEFMDIHPRTGRIVLTWTEFPDVGATSIKSTFSDDGGATWSPAATVGTPPINGSVQGSIPRFFPGATNASSLIYVVWRQSNSNGSRNIGFNRSLDGGMTWGVQKTITSDFTGEDYILGLDRVHTFPALAVDYTSGALYVVYQANNSVGEGDIAFQRSNDGGVTFSSRILINSNPGADRAQFYPWVTVDQSNGRIHAIWYDQDFWPSGDLTELMHSFSTDGGVAWSRPTSLFDRPFHAGYGNDTSQPNLGDYNQAVAISGTLHSVAAATSIEPRFDEGQPDSNAMVTPDTYYDRLPDATNVAAVRLTGVSCIRVDPPVGNPVTETLDLRIPLMNYVANPNNSPITLTGVSVTLTAITAGVTVVTGTQPYADIAPLATQINAAPFRIELTPAVAPGSYVFLTLNVATDQGATQLLYRLRTGSPGASTTLINENFDGVTAPNLPAGWSSAHGGGISIVPWVTSNTFTVNGTTAAYHEERTGVTRWERLYSPVITVTTPAAGVESYVTLDFDILYRLESEPLRNVLAYDGLTLRIADWTTGATFRTVLAEAFAENIATGAIRHFPKHTPRSSNPAYFQDMSVWSGDSRGAQHVSMRFPGAGMTGRAIQLRFEYTEDSFGDCTDSGSSAPCGVALDNIVLQHVQATSGACMMQRLYLPIVLRNP